MSLLYVKDVAALFRSYTNEPDESFLENDHVQLYLGQGFEEFRQVVTDLDADNFLQRVAVNDVGGQSYYDLSDTANAVVLVGPDVNLTETDNITGQPLRLTRLVRVGRPNTDNNNAYPSRILMPAPSQEALYQDHSGANVWGGAVGPDYHFDGRVLRFNCGGYTKLYLDVLPMATVDWSKQAASDTEYISEMHQFHDVIALLAFKHYSIRDGESNDALNAALQLRMAQLENHVRFRTAFGSQYIV